MQVIASQRETLSPRCLVIVARDESDLWFYLTRDLPYPGVLNVHLDRRREERRHWTRPQEPDRRCVDRRACGIDSHLHRHGFAVIHRQPEARSTTLDTGVPGKD
jgi:hypothetical protein